MSSGTDGLRARPVVAAGRDPHPSKVSVNFVRIVLAVDTLMQILDKPFNDKDLLHVYTIVRPKKEPSNPFYEGNHYLRLRKPDQPQMRLVIGNPYKDLFLDEFVWVSGTWEFRARDDGMSSFPSSFSYTSPDPIDSEEDEGEEVVSQLVLNRRLGRVISAVELEDPALPISISSSDNEHLDDLALALPQFMREVKAVEPNLGEANIIRFRNLNKTTPAAGPLPWQLFLSLNKQLIPIVELAEAIVRVPMSSVEAPPLGKRKGKEVSLSTPKRLKQKTGETSSVAAPAFWKPEFSACELTRPGEHYDFGTFGVVLPRLSFSSAFGLQSLQRAMVILDRMAEHLIELKKTKKKTSNLESKLKKARLALADVDQLKAHLTAAAEQSRPGTLAMRLNLFLFVT
ncbi:hypothetical protein Acr_27g0008700 [Actinidia rufa]|uniref:Uncharacterized protein n=1 Tax=Actinidia rufa TaxID=165716 RepID=A0A7J0H834_9ERIC|nr:hypothetical protein Acr_27g0008700 [Actinidia rufa]